MKNETAKALIEDLKEDVKSLEKLESNIEIIWALEKLHNQKILLRSAELLRKSLKQ